MNDKWNKYIFNGFRIFFFSESSCHDTRAEARLVTQVRNNNSVRYIFPIGGPTRKYTRARLDGLNFYKSRAPWISPFRVRLLEF